MTSTTQDNGSSQSLILKTDTRGRVMFTPQRRQELLEEFERSGLSGAKFAALAGIKYSTFAAWAQRWRASRGTASPQVKAQPVQWLEAMVSEAGGSCPAAGLLLALPGGVRLEISRTEQVTLAAALLKAIQQPC